MPQNLPKLACPVQKNLYNNKAAFGPSEVSFVWGSPCILISLAFTKTPQKREKQTHAQRQISLGSNLLSHKYTPADL